MLSNIAFSARQHVSCFSMLKTPCKMLVTVFLIELQMFSQCDHKTWFFLPCFSKEGEIVVRDPCSLDVFRDHLLPREQHLWTCFGRTMRPHPHRTRAREFKRKSFDVAGVQCEHSRSHTQVPFALPRVTRLVWMRPEIASCCSSG